METNNSVETKAILNALKNHQEGEVIFCEEDNTPYVWHNNSWSPVKATNSGLKMNLYDLNRGAIGQLKSLTKKEIEKKKDLFNSINNDNIHYMLLCKDYNYYTIFEKNKLYNETFADVVMEILSSIGEIKSIETALDKSTFEIWIKPAREKTAFVFYLFPYDKGVVYYG